jgi:peptide/nickel transport system substrate-binding protein
MFATAYAADSNWNEGFWKNDRFNELLVAARAELDEQKRRSMYVEMQRLCRDEGGSVIPLFPSDIMAATTKLKFDNVAANIEMDGCKLPERWWFAS